MEAKNILKGKYVFAKLLDFIDKYVFLRLLNKYDGNSYVKLTYVRAPLNGLCSERGKDDCQIFI
jgi:hypothetical protein